MTALTSELLRRGGEHAAALDLRPRSRRAILAALPAALSQRFDPAAAGELTAVFGLDVRDPRGGPATSFTLRVQQGACEVTRGPADTPGATVAVAAGDMIRMVSGVVAWPELLASGRLELHGDPFLALRFPRLFALPA